MSSKAIQVGLIMGYMGLFAAGMAYEGPSTLRMIQLVGIAALSAAGLFLPGLKKGQILILGIGVLLLGVLEANSKFSVNYLFHLMYYILLLNAYRRVGIKPFVGLAVLMMAVSTFKYLYLFSGNTGAVDFGEAGVMTTVSLLMVVILILAIGLREERNDVLSLNQKLNEAMADLEGLTLIKERNRVSREIHDTLGHELTALIMKMELSKHWHLSDEAQSQQYLKEAIDEGRKALKSVRHVVTALQAPQRSNEDLQLLFNRFKQTSSIGIDFKADFDLSEVSESNAHVIYRAVQEGLTNVLRHSNATTVAVTLKRKEALIELSLLDNGTPIQETVVEGFGLKAMRERVQEQGGTLVIQCHQGFGIQMALPVQTAKEG